jgi:hypothetical protein
MKSKPTAEIIILPFFVVGLLFKMLHWPFAGMLIVLSLGALATYYMYAFLLFKKSGPGISNGLKIFTGIASSILVVGILFKFQFWPGGRFFLFVGIITAVVVLIWLRNTAAINAGVSSFAFQTKRRLSVLLLVAAVLYLLPSEKLFQITHLEDAEFARWRIKYFENPHDSEISKGYHKYINQRDSIESLPTTR